MDIKTLEARIEKKNVEIEKIHRRIAKWVVGLNAEDEQAAMSMKWAEVKQYAADHNYDWQKADQIYELHRAYVNLQDAVTTLNKYKNALALEQSKESTTKIQVIVDFLNQWKQDVREFVAEDIHNADLYYEFNSRYCDLHNDRYSFIKEHGEEEWKKQMREIRETEKRYHDITNALTFEVWNRVTEDHINHTKLDEILDKEAEAKYWTMIEKVTKITGEITDATGLRIGHDGNINGYVVGDKGTAHLETIYAGGENVDRIVNVKHGPRLHFRLLVHEVK